MPQTNRIPVGFLDLIGAETGGKNPSQYNDVLQETVEISEFYLAQSLAGAIVSQNHAAPGNAGIITVPAEESWLLRAASVTTFPTALTDFEQWDLVITRMPRETTGFLNTPSIWSTRLIVPQLAAGQFPSDSFYLPRPLMLSAGVEIQFTLRQRDANPARNSTLELMVNRFV